MSNYGGECTIDSPVQSNPLTDTGGAFLRRGVGSDQSASPDGDPHPCLAQTSEARSYYTFGGDRVAMRTGGEVHYLHADHLGTAALTSDSNVAAIHAVRRYLFGA